MTSIVRSFLKDPGFDKQSFNEVCAETGSSFEKVAEETARFLLHHFSVEAFSFQQSQSSIEFFQIFETMRNRHLSIVDAMLKHKKVEELESMQKFLKGFHFSTSTQQMIEREKQEALLSHDEVVSFPNIYLGDKAQNRRNLKNIEKIYQVIDDGDSVQKEEKEALAILFHKHIALYQGKSLLSWAQLARVWAETTNQATKFNSGDKKISYWKKEVLSTFHIPTNLSFREFVYTKTLESLEGLCEVKLEGEVRQLFLEAIQSENFRMHLIFCIGHPEFLMKSIPQNNPLLLFLRRYLLLKKYYAFDKKYSSLLFQWIMLVDSNDHLKRIWDNADFSNRPIKNIDSYIEKILSSNLFISTGALEKNAFFILSECCNMCIPSKLI